MGDCSRSSTSGLPHWPHRRPRRPRRRPQRGSSLNADLYNFHDLLRLRVRRQRRTLVDGFLDTTFGYYRVSDPGAAETAAEPDIDVEIGPFQPRLDDTVVLDGRYWVRPDFIYYESRFKSARWRTEITGLETGPLRVRIDPNYTARLVFPGETIYSLIRLQLARRGLLLLHAPAVGRHGRSLLLPARGGTGKTITAVNFARRGWDFLGDDSCILAEDRAYSFVTPFNLRFTYDVERLLGVRFSTGKRAEIFLKKSLALATLRRITLFTRIPSQDVFGPQIIDSAPLGAVYLLIHGPRPAVSEPRPTDLFARQVFISTLFEADELRAMLLAYNYANPGSPLTRLWPEFESRLAQRLARAVCRQISVPQDYTPEVFEMIHDQAKRDLDPAAGEARP